MSIDLVIENVGIFKADLKASRKDYERIVQYLPQIGELKGSIESVLKKMTGYDAFNLPGSPVDSVFDIGDMHFKIRSDPKTKKPSYKTMVSGMEHYLWGIVFKTSTGSAITGIVKEKNEDYMMADRLKEEFEIIVWGLLEPEVRQTIRYTITGPLAGEEPLSQLIIPKKIYSPLTSDDGLLYLRLDRIAEHMTKFKKAYEKELTKGMKKKQKTKTTQISSTKAFDVEQTQRAGPRWQLVVKTLVTVPVEGAEEGELDKLAALDLKSARKAFPWYRLIEREVRNKSKLYVSIPSVYKRIQELKGIEPVKATVIVIEQREIL